MNAILLMLIVFILYVVAYRTYGRYLSTKIFRISDKNTVPAHEFRDGVDYIPTPKFMLFGHHFTTIAGLGPIVGPAIGMIWGWFPALMWVIFGSIFMGAVHDYSTLIISARSNGQTIGEYTGRIIGKWPRLAFQLIMQVLLTIVLSVFALIVSSLFMLYPESVIPIWSQIPLALVLGVIIKRKKNTILYSLVAVVLMYASMYLGILFPVNLSDLVIFNQIGLTASQIADITAIVWCIILYLYVSFASILPVNTLLQPRDFMNSLQLVFAMLIIVTGLLVANPVISAPPINHNAFSATSDIPGMAPILFIIIACGAISGFHSIASSGTTVKQLNKESDALFIGFGSMLTEGFLAVLVIVCIGAGLGLGFEHKGIFYAGNAAYDHFYSSWGTNQGGISANIQSFIFGTSNLLARIGIPANFSAVLIAVFIVSFANTTLDSATRMQRLSLQELLKKTPGIIHNRYTTTLLVVVMAAAITFLKHGGTGAKILWPLFGSLNQLLAALGLAVVSIYLYQKKKNYLITAIPMMFILIMTLWSMWTILLDSLKKQDQVIIILTCIILLLTLLMLVGGLRTIIRDFSNEHRNQ